MTARTKASAHWSSLKLGPAAVVFAGCLLSGFTLSGCGDAPVQTQGCEDVPLYPHRARFGGADGGLTAAQQRAIDTAVDNGCITDVGNAQSLPR